MATLDFFFLESFLLSNFSSRNLWERFDVLILLVLLLKKNKSVLCTRIIYQR